MAQAIARATTDTRGGGGRRGRAGPRAGGAPRRIAAALLLALAGCAGAAPAAGDAAPRIRADAEPASVAAALAGLDEFATLRRLVDAAGAGPLLAGRAPLTLLAPRDTAFAQLDPERRAALLAPATRTGLARAVDGLVIPRALRAEELRQMIDAAGGSVTIATRAGPLAFSREGAMLVVTAPSGVRATMGTSELATGNGTLYVLDRWLAAAP